MYVRNQHYLSKELDMPYKVLIQHDTKFPQSRTQYISLAEVTGLLHYGYTSLDLQISAIYTPENYFTASSVASLEKLIVVLLVRKFSACYEIQI
jgi:hypothetical protein